MKQPDSAQGVKHRPPKRTTKLLQYMKNNHSIALAIYSSVTAAAFATHYVLTNNYSEKWAIEKIGPEPIIPAEEASSKLPPLRQIEKIPEPENPELGDQTHLTNLLIERQNKNLEQIHALKYYNLQQEYSSEWRGKVKKERGNIDSIITLLLIAIGAWPTYKAASALTQISINLKQAISRGIKYALRFASLKHDTSLTQTITTANNNRILKNALNEHKQAEELFDRGLISDQEFKDLTEKIKRKVEITKGTK
jgi:hypothetical protein